MKFIGIFMIFSAFIAATSAITCYDCSSLNDTRCYDDVFAEGVQKTDCDELESFENILPATGCITKIHEGGEDDETPYYIRRGCFFGYDNDTKEACNAEDRYVPWAKMLDCQVCTDNLCNTKAGWKGVGSKMLNVLVLF